MNAEIIAVGSELLTPYRQDSNSLFLTEKLNQLGVEVAFKTIVGDRRAHIEGAVKLALERADLVISIGGLGPTEDDLTRESVAAAVGRGLGRDPALLGELYARFARRRLKMPENNLRQADVIQGAETLPNPNGTAPGQWLEAGSAEARQVVVLLPGPPNELMPMFENHCMVRLRALVPPLFIATRVLKVALMPESQLDERVAPIYSKAKKVETTLLAAAGEVQLHLRARANSQPVAEKLVEELADKIEDELEDAVYSRGGETLEQIAGYYLQMRGATIAVAESCTGGLVAERLTRVSGSSRYFLGGIVAYTNDLKSAFVDVPKKVLEAHGAVSREVAVALAEGIRKRAGSTLGIGITGIAGPTGGSGEKPVGLVFHALADGRKTEVVERTFPGDRKSVRWQASQQALDMVRKKLI
jgi:nicotinamide-nucleotide amidase